MKVFCLRHLLVVLFVLLTSYLAAQRKQNIQVKPLYSDSLSSAFEIIVRDSVRLHYHAAHTEHLFVLEGEARMQIGEKVSIINKGEYFTIPKGTHHAAWVLSKTPLKVISVQSPQFLGKDRHFIDND